MYLTLSEIFSPMNGLQLVELLDKEWDREVSKQVRLYLTLLFALHKLMVYPIAEDI